MTLATHQGRYPAGTSVWFPEGGIMEHGATQDEDCTFLFITNKPFAIHCAVRALREHAVRQCERALAGHAEDPRGALP